MYKFVFTALASAILLLSASPVFAQADNAQLTGTVTYRERMALPADAVIDVQLLDTSVADIAAQTVAEVLINAEGRQVPVPFMLTYDPAKIDAAHRYSVRATIRSGDGMLMFSSTQAYPVLTHSAPLKANLILYRVGHGAKPGAAAKKQTASAASEGTTSGSQSAAPAASETAPATEPTPATTAAPAAESAQNAVTPSSDAPANSTAQANPEPTQTESGAPPSSTATETAPPSQSESAAATEASPSQAPPPTVEPPGSQSAPENSPTATEAAPPAPSANEQTAPASETPAAQAPETAATQPESTTAATPPATTEPTTPAESRTEPTTPAPEVTASEPEAPLPEAPSASKHIEAPRDSEENNPEGESSSGPERALPKAATPLASTNWRLIQLDGQDVVITPPQKPMTISFSPEGRRIGGMTGCNSYLGTFNDDHGHIDLHPGNMTMMACADPAGSRERKFVAMLRSADGYKIDGGVLLLTSNGKTVAKFQNNQ